MYCQVWESGGVRLLHDSSFLLALLYFDLSHPLNMHKSGKDFQVLYFPNSVYQDLIRTMVWSARIPGETSGASPAPYWSGASAT